MAYLGDFAEDATITFGFSTVGTTGAPVTIDGAAAVQVYKDMGLTQITTGITVSEDFDGVTGFHKVEVDMSADAAYTTGSDYLAVISVGAADTISIVGGVLNSWSCENRYHPTTDADNSAYFATVKVDTRGVADRYMVQWYKDAQLAGTVTLPDLQVIDSTGADLIAPGGNDTELVIDGNAVYYTEATSRLQPGQTYIIKVTGTIDGTARTFKVPYMVDASKEAAELAFPGTVNTAIAATTTSFFSSDFETVNGAMGNTAVANRWVLFTSGLNLGIARLITAYDGSGNFTVEAFPQAPSNGDAFRVVGAYKGA